MGRKKPTSRDDESGPAGVVAGGKSKKKALVIADDEYSIGTELSEDAVVPEENLAPLGNKKKGKKGGSKKTGPKDEDDDTMDNEVVEEEEDDAPAIRFAGKKKSKGKKSGTNSMFSSSAFGLLGEDEEGDDNETKDNEDEDEELGEPVIAFSGKKKPSKSKKGGGGFSSAFDLLNEEEEEGKDNEESSKEEEEDVGITFTGKKKKKSSKGLNKPSGNSFSAVVLDEENDEDVSVSKTGNDNEDDVSKVKFSGKKKSSKKKNVASEVGNGDVSSDFIEPTQHIDESATRKQSNDDVAETSTKNKKKKKKGGKAGQEEDDLDKILAELGAVPPESKHVPTSAETPPEENVQTQQEVEEEKEEEGPAESVAAKKKKKKKEKEKEKKAAAAAVAAEEKLKETETEASNKQAGKKLPKHVREMQEKLSRMKVLEEKRKREEEEKQRKEEEERLRKEEEERIAEEKKRLKKEKEKEKLLKKKLEGKLLTGKQKEEARRLEAMRRQILGNASLQIPAGETAGVPAKRPLYQKKKPKPQTQSNGAATLDSAEGTDPKETQQEIMTELDSPEGESVEDVASSSAKDKNDATDVVQENVVDDDDEEEEQEEQEEDDDEEWDAKSWDEADLKLPGKSAFADEEVDSEPEPLVRKEIKSARTATQDVELPSVATKTAEKVASVIPQRSENVDVKKKNSEAEDSDKNNTKSVVNREKNKKEQKSADPPAQNGQNLRSPICCIMGHVDTGKTKLLDCIRGTNVQEGEAGGITQQIGATYFPAENIRERTRELKADARLNVPGLLVIDTPGHESFTNLRSRGSGLCDIAILVVDIMHGLEPQTIESLNLLKMRNTDFIVALNKVDRIYGWRTCRNAPIKKALSQQNRDVEILFNDGLKKVKNQLQEQGLNTELYYKNKEMGETYNIVPTSAISGEGIPDLLLLLVQWTQRTMIERLTYSDEVQCTVLEVKVVEGHGTTIDVVLVNGVLHEGDQIVVCGMQGPIVTSIRALLTPHPMKELRVKAIKFIVFGEMLYAGSSNASSLRYADISFCNAANHDIHLEGTYLHHKEIKAAMGIKITAQGLEHTIAGTSLYVVGPRDDLEEIKEAAMEDMKSIGTPLCVPQREFIEIGRIASIENNHKPVDYAKKGQKVAIKIIGSNPDEQQKMFGRHFEMEDELVSKISRNSLDALKENYADDLSVEEKRLLFKLKKLFKIL
ncbi:eukaryotic translation initiation factor 5b [Phtheirospermum japonicum]|uniref:Eukaryotic translation initiation factor 5b n=1 Tax=Phtheirospermum japonicum TaxID=374723 RepID=A0A830B3H0_9LAMI|nr:eukaryotic translation initiation factor 5b [Phtheirospermum japonicum]